MIDIRLNWSIGKFILTLLILCIVTTHAHAQTKACKITFEPKSIAQLLGSEERAQRNRGVAELRQQGQAAMNYLTMSLYSPHPAHRRGAVIGLALLPIPALTIDALMKGLEDDDPVVRSLAAHALAKVSRFSAQPVARLLAHPNDKVRVAAALSLSKMGPDAVVPLVKMIDQQTPLVTAKAAWLLGNMGSVATPAVPALVRALDNEDQRVVHVIADALDQINPNPTLLRMEFMTIGNNKNLCPGTRLGETSAEVLTKLLARPGTPTTRIAFYTLARTGQIVIPALKNAIETGTPSQQVAAALLLMGMDPETVNTFPENLRRSLAGAVPTQ